MTSLGEFLSLFIAYIYSDKFIVSNNDIADANSYPIIYLINKHFGFYFTYEHNLSIRLIELQYL